MKALVIGATGIIGSHVVRALLAEGIEVRAFSRGVKQALNLEGLDVERFKGDLNDPASLKEGAKGCAWVFHTAGYYPTHSFNLNDHLRKASTEIKRVLDAVEHPSLERFVFTSSLTTIGRPAYFGELADENCRYDLPKPPHPYFAVKIVMEEEVKRRAMRGYPAVIVNPTGCFGPYELKPIHLCLVPQLIRGKILAFVDGKLNAVDVADVGRGHVLAAQKGKIGERYILGGHDIFISDLLRTICRLGKCSPPKIRVPVKVAVAAAWASEFLSHYVFNSSSVLSVLGLKFVEYGQHFSLEKARNELGYTVSPLEPCLTRAIDWYRRIGYC